MSGSGEPASGGTPASPLAPSACVVTYRRGRASDCDGIRRVVNNAGWLLYERLRSLFDMDWTGKWAERLQSPDQIYVVAETERFAKFPELVGMARMQRNRLIMQMTESEVALLAEHGGGLDAVAAAKTAGWSKPAEVAEGEDPLTGPQYDAELMSVFVARDFQGLGVGTTATRLVAQLAREEFGPTAFCWAVDEEATRQFYAKKCGGQPIGLRPSTREGRFGMAFALDFAMAPPVGAAAVGLARAGDGAEGAKGKWIWFPAVEPARRVHHTLKAQGWAWSLGLDAAEAGDHSESERFCYA